jgi:hypothetical protein
VVAVQVGEDAVLVLQAALSVDRRRILDSGHATLLLTILSGSYWLRRSSGERADRALVEDTGGSGRGAKCGLCRGGKHCDGGQCRYLSRLYVRLRRLESSWWRCLVLVLGWSGEWCGGGVDTRSRSMMPLSRRLWRRARSADFQMLLIGSSIQLTPGLADIRPHFCIQLEIRCPFVHISHDIYFRSQSSIEAYSISHGCCIIRLGNEVVDSPAFGLACPPPVYSSCAQV